MNQTKSLLLTMAGLASLSLAQAQEAVVLTESFELLTSPTTGGSNIPWEIKKGSRPVSIDGDALAINTSGEYVIFFAPISSGEAAVDVEVDVTVSNRKDPDSAKVSLYTSIDGNEWTEVATQRGAFSGTLGGSFQTTESFQLRLVANGNRNKKITFDNLDINIQTLDSAAVDVAETIWSENFDGLPHGATSDDGETSWREYSESGTYSGVRKGVFKLSARRADAYLETEAIDISSFSGVSVNAEITYKKRVGTRLEASVDGGEWLPLWSENIEYLQGTRRSYLTGTMKGDSLKLRVSTTAWSVVDLHGIDVHAFNAKTSDTPGPGEPPTPEPKPEPSTQLAQFSAVQNSNDIWHLDASTSDAFAYRWTLDGTQISTEPTLEIEIDQYPADLELQAFGQTGGSTTVSQTLTQDGAFESEFTQTETESTLAWPTFYLGFSQIEIADDLGVFSPVGEPISGTGFSAYFVSSQLSEIRVSQELNFDGFDYSGQNLDHLDMGKSKATKANFDSVTGRLVYLDHSDLRSSNWENAALSFAELHDADMSGARLFQSSFIDCVFDNANLSNADLRGANLTNSDFRNANLSNANLGNANLANADLRGANLEGANLSGANLAGALRD